MVFTGGGLGIILHLAWLACLFFIMAEQSVPVHSVPVSDTVHLHLPVPELSDMATTVQSTGALVQDHDSDVPQRAQCIVKRFQKRSSTHPTPPLERSASPPSVDAFQQAVDTFISGTESVSLELPGSESPSLPPSPAYDADFEWVASMDRSDEPASSGDTSGADSWHLLSGTSRTSTLVDAAAPALDLSPLRTGRLLFDTSPAGALPIAASVTQEAQVESRISFFKRLRLQSLRARKASTFEFRPVFFPRWVFHGRAEFIFVLPLLLVQVPSALIKFLWASRASLVV